MYRKKSGRASLERSAVNKKKYNRASSRGDTDPQFKESLPRAQCSGDVELNSVEVGSQGDAECLQHNVPLAGATRPKPS